jgi:hypothetical protein
MAAASTSVEAAARTFHGSRSRDASTLHQPTDKEGKSSPWLTFSHQPNVAFSCGRPRSKCAAPPRTPQAGQQLQCRVRLCLSLNLDSPDPQCCRGPQSCRLPEPRGAIVRPELLEAARLCRTFGADFSAEGERGGVTQLAHAVRRGVAEGGTLAARPARVARGRGESPSDVAHDGLRAPDGIKVVTLVNRRIQEKWPTCREASAPRPLARGAARLV